MGVCSLTAFTKNEQENLTSEEKNVLKKLIKQLKEEEQGVVSVRSRFEGNEGTKSLDEFVEQICKEIRTKEIRVELPEEEKKR